MLKFTEYELAIIEDVFHSVAEKINTDIRTADICQDSVHHLSSLYETYTDIACKAGAMSEVSEV